MKGLNKVKVRHLQISTHIHIYELSVIISMFTANVCSPWGHFEISSYWKPISMSTIPRIDILNSAFSFTVIKFHFVNRCR